MPVLKDPSGQRRVSVEVEVPGTPEQVWQAIATGPGISRWFVPTEMDGRPGGSAVSHFAAGNAMDSVATIRDWDPPHRFVADTTEGPGTVATEWTVEARSGSLCVVRVVHSWFASSDEWDDQFEMAEHGWRALFRILHLYLAHFAGESVGAGFQLLKGREGEQSEIWRAVIAGLGWSDIAPSKRMVSAGTAPPSLVGVVEHMGPVEYPEILFRLEAPAPGWGHLFAMPMGGQVYLSLRLYFFGDQAPVVAAEQERLWDPWLDGVAVPGPT